MRELQTPASRCRFGIAIRDITPPVGMYHRMWGAARKDRSIGVHRPLRGSAIVLGDPAGSSWRALVAIDHCLLFSPEAARLREQLTAPLPVELDGLVVTFSHTHAAGLLDPSRAGEPGGELIAPYLDELAEKLASALSAAFTMARDAVESLNITWGTGRCDLARHRDFREPDTGRFVCGFNPGAPADDTLLVARVSDDSGEILATLVNYACHPTTLAWENELISPDFPGAMRELIEFSTAAPCVFVQGASGDLGPRDGFTGAVAVAERNGRHLGHAALSVLEGMPPPASVLEYAGAVVSGATIGTWRHRARSGDELEAACRFEGRRLTVPLPYRELPGVERTRERLEAFRKAEREARDAHRDDVAAETRAMAERMTRQLARLSQLPEGPIYPLELDVWRLGDAVVLAVPGEPYSILQFALRRRFRDTPILVATISDGWGPSYLPPREAYGLGIYQEEIAVIAPGGLELVIEMLAKELDGMLRCPAS